MFRLTITKAQMDDAGTYKVEAVYGKSTASSTGKLTVERMKLLVMLLFSGFQCSCYFSYAGSPKNCETIEKCRGG